MRVSHSGTCTAPPVGTVGPLGTGPWNSSDGISAKPRTAAMPPSLSPSTSRAYTRTLTAIRLRVTHWKRIARSGLSSEIGMKTTLSSPSSRSRQALPVLARHPQHIVLSQVVDVAACHEQQIRQAIDILENGGIYVRAGFACER